MANNYTSVPNIIPGNLTVGGTLNVQGDELKIGLTAPFVRLYKATPDQGGWSVNLAKDAVTRDLPTNSAYTSRFGSSSVGYYVANNVTPNGVVKANAKRVVMFTDSSVRTGTGAGGPLVAYSKVLPGYAFGPSGIFMVRVWGTAVTVAGGSIGFNAAYGAAVFPAPGIAASLTSQFLITYFVSNVNAMNIQRMMTFVAGVNIVSPNSVVSTSVDSSADQTITLGLVFGNAADTATIFGTEGTLLNSVQPQ